MRVLHMTESNNNQPISLAPPSLVQEVPRAPTEYGPDCIVDNGVACTPETDWNCGHS